MNRTPWVLRQPEPPLRGEILHPFSFAPPRAGPVPLQARRPGGRAAASSVLLRRRPFGKLGAGAVQAPGDEHADRLGRFAAGHRAELRLSGSGMRGSWISVSLAGRHMQRMPSQAGSGLRRRDVLSHHRPHIGPVAASTPVTRRTISSQYRAMSMDSITVSERMVPENARVTAVIWRRPERDSMTHSRAQIWVIGAAGDAPSCPMWVRLPRLLATGITALRGRRRRRCRHRLSPAMRRARPAARPWTSR